MGDMSVKGAVETQRVELQRTETVELRTNNGESTNNAPVFETAANDIKFAAQSVKHLLNETFDLQAAQAAPANQQADVDAAAQRVWDAAENDPEAAAAILDDEIRNLNSKYGADAGGALINKLHQDSKADDYDRRDLTNVLTFAGANGSAADKFVIGRAVGNAYNSMSAEDRTAFTNDLAGMTAANAFRSNFVNNGSTALAEIITRSGNDQLKQDTVAAMVKHATDNVSDGWSLGPWDFNNGGVDINALYNSAAMIANTGSTKAAETRMFGTITDSFEDLTDAQMRILEGNPGFKDQMSTLFMNNSTEVLHSLTGNNGRFDNNPKVDGFRRFMELTLFSSNPGGQREALMGEMTKTISEFADPNASPTAGRTKEADATLAGGLLALTQSAAIFQKDDINANQESRKEAVEFFTGMAFAFIPGASDALGSASGSLTDFAYEQAQSWAEDNGNSALAGFINNMSDGKALENIKTAFEAMRGLHFTISGETLQDHPDLAAAFDSGYASIGVDQLFQKAIE